MSEVKKETENWGNINAIVNAPLENVAGDATWISVICMWLTLPLSCIQGIIGGLCNLSKRTNLFQLFAFKIKLPWRFPSSFL